MAAASFVADVLGTAAGAGTIDASLLSAANLSQASVDIASIALMAFDQENNDAPVWVPATSLGGGGGAAGGFTPVPETNPGAAFLIGSDLNGIHKILDVAAAGELRGDALVPTRVAITAAATGSTTVSPTGGASYHIKGVDDHGDPWRSAAITLVPAGVYEFEVVEVSGGVARWDVYGLPAGGTTKLAGPLDLNGQQIIPGAPTAVTAVRTYLTTDSGKSFRVDSPATTTSTQTINAGMGAGWRVTILNNTASTIPIAGPGSTLTLASGEVCEVMFWSTTTIKVARGATTGIN